MKLITKRKRVKKLPPPAIGIHDGRPILEATAKRNRDGSHSITVICPTCGKPGRHGLPPGCSVEGIDHRAADCSCWPRGYFFKIVLVIEAGAR